MVFSPTNKEEADRGRDYSSRYRSGQARVPGVRYGRFWGGGVAASGEGAAVDGVDVSVEALPGGHGGELRRAPLGGEAERSGSRRADDESSVCASVREVEQERLPRRGGDLRGGVTSDDAFRALQDEGASGASAGASEPGGDGGSAHAVGEPVAGLSGGVRDRVAAGAVGGDAGGARDRIGPGAGPAGRVSGFTVHAAQGSDAGRRAGGGPDLDACAGVEGESSVRASAVDTGHRSDGVDGAGGVGGQRLGLQQRSSDVGVSRSGASSVLDRRSHEAAGDRQARRPIHAGSVDPRCAGGAAHGPQGRADSSEGVGFGRQAAPGVRGNCKSPTCGSRKLHTSRCVGGRRPFHAGGFANSHGARCGCTDGRRGCC